MRIINLISIVILLSITTGCTSLHDKIYEGTPTVKRLKGGIISYRGYINIAGYQLIQKKYERARTKPTLLIIKSGGGDPYAGMLMGRFLREHHMDIKIRDYCFSACANNLFPAANTKYIEKNAIVGFHRTGLAVGNEHILLSEVAAKLDDLILVDSPLIAEELNTNDIIQSPIRAERILYYPEYSTRCAEMKAYPTREVLLQQEEKRIIGCFNYLREQKKLFFEELHIDSRLTQMGIPKLIRAQQESDGAVKLYYYDRASLIALGVSKVIYASDWNPANNKYYEKMVKVTLNDWQP